jgi:hypothetical protein
MTAQRTLIPALVLAAGLACTTSAQAQPYGRAYGYSRTNQNVAFDNGYRAGFDRGRDDVRDRRYDYGRYSAYRDGDSGYDRDYGDRGDYRESFRQGFIAGYDDGYYGRAARDYSYNDDRSRDDRYRPLPAPPPVYGNAYPNSYPYNGGYYPNGGGYGVNPGFDRGYRDGIDKGRDDGEDHRAFDPRRQKWFRDGDRGYKDKYGPKWSYENAYRDGFLRGYDQGYREKSRY